MNQLGLRWLGNIHCENKVRIKRTKKLHVLNAGQSMQFFRQLHYQPQVQVHSAYFVNDYYTTSVDVC